MGLGASGEGGLPVLACWRLADAATGRQSPCSFSRQASGCHWAAAGIWGLPVPPGAGGLGDGAVPVRLAGTPVLSGLWGSPGSEKETSPGEGCWAGRGPSAPAGPLEPLGVGGGQAAAQGPPPPCALPVGPLPRCPPAPAVSSLEREGLGPRPPGREEVRTVMGKGRWRQDRPGHWWKPGGGLGAVLKSDPPGWVTSQAE